MFFSLLVFKIGLFTVKDSFFALMDLSPSKEIENNVKDITESIVGIEDFDDLKLGKSGPFIFDEVNVKIRKHVDVVRAHEISNNLSFAFFSSARRP